jgi:Flp pilus assembly secretin CpaC
VAVVARVPSRLISFPVAAMLAAGCVAAEPAAADADRMAVAEAERAADLAAAAGRPAEGLAGLEAALVVARDQGYESAVIARIQARLTELRRQTAVAAAAADDQGRRGSLAAASGTADEIAGRGRGVRGERLARVREAHARGHLEVAMGECRRLADDHPGDEEIERLYARILADLHDRRRLDHRAALDELRQEIALRTEMDMLPIGGDGWPRFPSDWQARFARRQEARGAEVRPAWREVLDDRLAERVALVVDNVSGIEVLQNLAKMHQFSLVIDPAVVAGKDVAVTLRVPAMRLDHLLSWVTRSMGTSWSLSKGAVWIGDSSEQEVVLGVHDVGALLSQAVDMPERQVSLTTTAASGPSLFTTQQDTAGKAMTAEEVADLIKAGVGAALWERPGHGITIRGRTLLVAAPAEVHKLIGEFIRAQERQANLQVRIESRWLEVQDRFFEEIGVDWTTNRSQTPFQGGWAGHGFYRQSPNAQTSADVTNLLPATAMAINPAVGGTGLTLGTVLLNQIQASVVLVAVERSSKARVVEGSSVVTLNGIRANIFTGDQVAYISTYEVVSGNLDPKIQTITTGLNLDVRPIVSSDRRYVTLEFRPSVSTLSFFTETIQAPRSLPSGRINVFTGDIITPIDPLIPPPGLLYQGTYPIELPHVQLREASTTATLPDRGSLLAGGFNSSLDQATRTQVPYLGSIPWLGRLFGRRGRYSQHDRLFLLTSATIIAYDELETKL